MREMAIQWIICSFFAPPSFSPLSFCAKRTGAIPDQIRW